MALLKDLQAKGTTVARIRTGISVIGKNGKQRPEKLTRFLITTESRHIAESVAATYGGEVQPYMPMLRDVQKGWQVLVEVDEIPVAVPANTQVVSQWWEIWSGGGLKRRCDGEVASSWEVDPDTGRGAGESRGPCRCPADLMERANGAASGRTCRPSTRVNLILPDVPGTGMFMVESHGLYAAQEMGQVAELMGRASAAGVVLPALLRLEQREGVRREGETTNRFAVPVLQLLDTPRQLLAKAEAGPAASMLPPPPPALLALTAGSATPPPGLPGQPDVGGPMSPDTPQGLRSAQDAADQGRAATDVEALLAIGRAARDAGWMEEQVEVEPDTFEELGTFLLGLRERLIGDGS